MNQPSYLSTPQGRRLAYHKLEGKSPGIVFFTGFKSDMSGAKALALEELARARGQAFLRFDYSGHGLSSGAFEEGTIGAWKEDALAALDALTEGPQILVGSSMGGWIALLVALARPERLHALVTLAAAPDFTELLIWQQFNAEQRAQLMEQGVYYVPNCYGEEPYAITRALIEEGREHLLLTPGDRQLPIICPIRLLHGMRDEDVPYQLSQKILESVHSEDVELTLIKNGNHRLSEPGQLRLLQQTVAGLL